MPTLSATTPVGTFTRTTATAYAWIVVRRSAEAAKAAATSGPLSGVDARWRKDLGYAVTWHTSRAAADRAASRPYAYDRETEIVGIFAVESA